MASAGAAALMLRSTGQPTASLPKSLRGSRLYRHVREYAALGPHRTSSQGDAACSAWMQRRLTAAGFLAETALVPFPLFSPQRCSLEIDRETFGTFPAWPVVTTSPLGLEAPLVPEASPDAHGRIVLLSPAFRQGSSLVLPGFGDAIMAAEARGAAGVVLVTNGPTGEIIGLNADDRRFRWKIPVVLAAGRDGQRLQDAARAGASARLLLTGRLDSAAAGTNVVARRRGRGATLVVSTPKSGWFTCAGERGSGVAIFLGLAEALAARTDADLLFVATTGHEIEGRGGHLFLKSHAPPVERVRLWLHLGAHVASNSVDLASGRPVRLADHHATRGILVSAGLTDAATRAFKGQLGYQEPVDVTSPKAVGEVILYRDAGYSPVIGLVGGHPLHHTPLDLPHLATSPQALEAVARGVYDLVLSALGQPR